MIVYLITNTITSKKYVGMTACSVDRRFRDHCRSALKSPRVPIHLAIAKYGAEAFSVEVIAHAKTRAQLCKIERQLIKKLDCRVPNGYNLTPGGDGYSDVPLSPEARRLISLKNKAAWARLTLEERAERGRRISLAKHAYPVNAYKRRNPLDVEEGK